MGCNIYKLRLSLVFLIIAGTIFVILFISFPCRCWPIALMGLGRHLFFCLFVGFIICCWLESHWVILECDGNGLGSIVLLFNLRFYFALDWKRGPRNNLFISVFVDWTQIIDGRLGALSFQPRTCHSYTLSLSSYTSIFHTFFKEFHQNSSFVYERSSIIQFCCYFCSAYGSLRFRPLWQYPAIERL